MLAISGEVYPSSAYILGIKSVLSLTGILFFFLVVSFERGGRIVQRVNDPNTDLFPRYFCHEL